MDVNRTASAWNPSLTGMPEELLGVIAETLPIEDVAALFASDSGFHHLYESGGLGEGKPLRTIGPAMIRTAGISELQTALQTIATLPLGVQAKWLRRIAEQHPGLTRDVGNAMVSTWDHAFDALKTALREAPCTPERVLALADLDIAFFHVTFPQLKTPMPKGVIASRITGWMSKCMALILGSSTEGKDKAFDPPLEVWPDMLDALLSRGGNFVIADVNALFTKIGARALPSVSDRLATTIAVSLMQNHYYATPYYTHIADTMQTRLGVTDAQRREILNPLIASRFCMNISSTELLSPAARWAEGDAAFASLVEKLTLEPLVSVILHPISKHHATPTSRHIAQFLRSTEPDAVAAYFNMENQDDLGVEAEVRDRLKNSYFETGRDALTKFYMDLGVKNGGMPAFMAIKAAPRIAQPMLMDRWASCLNAHPFSVEDSRAVIEDITLWRQSIVLEMTQLNKPNAMARAFVAEVRCVANMFGGNDQQSFSRITPCLDAAFSTLAIRSLCPLLLLLHESSEQGRPLISSATLSQHIRSFLREPEASGQFLSWKFSERLGEEASLIFGQLPDCAIGLRSKCDVFFDRIGVQYPYRVFLLRVIEDGIASTLPVDAVVLKTVVRSHLVGLGIVDEDAVERVHQRLRALVPKSA